MKPLLLLLCAILPLVAYGSDDLRSEFRAAFKAADPSARDRPELREYPLYPWLQAERLRVRLAGRADGALDSVVAGFLDAHGSAPYTQALRGAWLDSLYARRQWRELQAALGSRPEEPTRLCQWLLALLAQGQTDTLREDALVAWSQGRSMPDDCDPVFGWLRGEGLLTTERVEARLRLALDANELRLARYLTGLLPEARRRIWTNGRLAREQGGPFLERLIADPEAPIFFRDLEAGLHHFARRDPAGARGLLGRLLAARRFRDEETHELVLAVALPSAWARHTEALPLFQRVPTSAHDEQQLEWRVRAASWARDWSEVARGIAAMPEGLAQEARWRYWAARASVARGEAEPEAAYASLAQDRSFHGFLAAARIGRPPRLAPKVTPRDADTQRHLAALPAVRRAHEWYHLEESSRAAAELAWGLDGVDADRLEQAALMLADWNWHPQAIAWMARSDRWDDLWLRFPLPFAGDFQRAAGATGVPLAWLHTIVRTESLYDPRAVSGAGARGIAQVMPGTASGIARRNGLSYRGADELFDVSTNLLLGAHYLRELDRHFDGDWLLVIPAYNAGRGRIPGWLPPAPLDADIWMENIPFHETRGYLQRALYHYVIVHWRLTGEPGNLLPFLDRTVPRGATSSRGCSGASRPSS